MRKSPSQSSFRTKTPIFTAVFYVTGNQVKSLWSLEPFSSAEFCQELLCDVETLHLQPPALIKLLMVKDTEPSLSVCLQVSVRGRWPRQLWSRGLVMFMAVLRRLSHAKGAGQRLSRQYVHVRLIVRVCNPLLSLLPLAHAWAHTQSLEHFQEFPKVALVPRSLI